MIFVTRIGIAPCGAGLTCKHVIPTMREQRAAFEILTDRQDHGIVRA